MTDRCSYCGYPAGLDFVHGHYQCRSCKQNVIPCCNGEVCDFSGIMENVPQTEAPPEKKHLWIYPQDLVENPDPDVDECPPFGHPNALDLWNF